MIIKLYSMPRAGSHWIGHNIEMTWPGVQVWHNKGGWKHGSPKEHPMVDAYLFCYREMEDWLDAMYRYIHYHKQAGVFRESPAQNWWEHEDILRMHQLGWFHLYGFFAGRPKYIWEYDADTERMIEKLKDIQQAFRLPEPARYYVEHRYMRKYADSDLERHYPFRLEHMLTAYEKENITTRPREYDENLAHDLDPDSGGSSGHP